MLSLLIATVFICFTAAQSIVEPTTAAASATALASAYGYTYAGCYNETTGIAGAGGARALPDMSVCAKEPICKNMMLTQHSPPTTR